MTTTIETPDLSTASQPSAPTPTPKRRPGLNTETLALSALFVSLFAFAAAIIAVGVAGRAIDEHQAVAAPGARPGGAQVEVSLSEFMIMPGRMSVAAGSTLAVTNEGSVAHNLAVAGLTTPDLAPGGQVALDVSGLAPGTYALICAIPGHREAGMETTLTIE